MFHIIRTDAWTGLTKPMATFKAGDIQDCAIKCNIMKAECNLIQYNDVTKDCSPAKVASALVTYKTSLSFRNDILVLNLLLDPGPATLLLLFSLSFLNCLDLKTKSRYRDHSLSKC